MDSTRTEPQHTTPEKVFLDPNTAILIKYLDFITFTTHVIIRSEIIKPNKKQFITRQKESVEQSNAKERPK